jgi:Family of unknown function (DUF5715)/LysM domain
MQSTALSARSRYRRATALSVLAVFALATVSLVHAQSLKGSRNSLLRQNEEARYHDFTYLKTSSQVRSFVNQGLLVRLRGNSDYRLASDYVAFPYARPEVKLFIERLAKQYRGACGERLYVTSLTRPLTRQPPNASHLSVHPTGMAMDLRRSNRSSCRRWLEETLLYLEGREVVEATREQHPPHYHVTLFPKPYRRYLGKDEAPRIQIAKSSGKKYRVGRGDTLWSIAKKHGVSVIAVKKANGIRSSHLRAGQTLSIPAR